MTRARPRMLLFLALAIGAAPLCAQTDKTAQPPAGAEQTVPAPQPEPDGKKQTADPAAANAAKKRAGASGGSPYDYRSSEEISEDLPVSFPADI